MFRSPPSQLVPLFLASLAVTQSLAAGLSQPQLAKIARQAIEEGEVLIAEPVIVTEGGVLRWYLGGATCVLDVNQENVDPQREVRQIPLTDQLMVEVVRKYRPNQPLLGQLAASLGKAEEHIAEELRVAQDPALKVEEKQDRLFQIQERIYGIYNTAMDEEARSRGLKAEAQSGAAGPGMVELLTDPPGGEIYIMHAVEARLAKAEQRKPHWQKVTDPSNVPANGTYWYAFRRDGQMKVGARPIRLKTDQTYTLR